MTSYLYNMELVAVPKIWLRSERYEKYCKEVPLNSLNYELISKTALQIDYLQTVMTPMKV